MIDVTDVTLCHIQRCKHRFPALSSWNDQKFQEFKEGLLGSDFNEIEKKNIFDFV